MLSKTKSDDLRENEIKLIKDSLCSVLHQMKRSTEKTRSKMLNESKSTLVRFSDALEKLQKLEEELKKILNLHNRYLTQFLRLLIG